MNFFQKLTETGIENVVIEVKKSEAEAITVFITPKSKAKDEALNKLKPIFVTGLPEEIDAEFFNLISEPLRDTQKVFSNIEAYEAQKAEIQKETAEKKDAKAKATADAKKAKDEEGKVEKVPVVKEVVINNEKVLKEFMTSIKGENILTHKDKIEELYALCNEAELDKPFAKKVRIDLDIAIRKQKNIDDARARMGFAPKLDIDNAYIGTEETIVETETAEIVIAEEKIETESSTLTEKEIEEIATQEPPLTTKESFKQRNAVPVEAPQTSPNENPAMVPGAVEEQSVEEMDVEDEEIISEEDMEAERIYEAAATLANVQENIVQNSVPVPPAPPAPPTPPVMEEVLEFVMIVTDGTKEDYMKAGWSEEQLIQHGKGHWVKVVKEVSAPPKVGYTFPKPFDAPDQE